MEELVSINGIMCKLNSNVQLTPNQIDNVIKQASNMGINTMVDVILAGVTVTITGVGPIATPTWSGVTDAAGIAKSAGLSPRLTYGDYTVVATKTGYTSGTATFNVPAVSAKTIRIIIIANEIIIKITD